MDAQKQFDALLASMKDIDDADRFFRGLFYGANGVGKTVLAMQIAQAITPPGKDIAYVDSHSGFKVVLNPQWKRAGLGNRTRRFQYESYGQLRSLGLAIKAELFDIGCIVLDESSSMSAWDLQDVLADHVARNVKDVNPDVPQWPQYNAEKNRYASLMNDIYAAPVHVIQIAHRRTDLDAAKRQMINPDFIPSLMSIITQPLDVCGYMTADVTVRDGMPVYERKVQVHPTKLITGPKSRIDGLAFELSPEEMKTAVVEWLTGDRDTNEVDFAVYVDPVPHHVLDPADSV
jgi:hypothetical protein